MKKKDPHDKQPENKQDKELMMDDEQGQNLDVIDESQDSTISMVAANDKNIFSENGPNYTNQTQEADSN